MPWAASSALHELWGVLFMTFPVWIMLMKEQWFGRVLGLSRAYVASFLLPRAVSWALHGLCVGLPCGSY